jgi:hypothetical protein
LLGGFVWAFVKMNKKPSKINNAQNVESKEKK